MVMPKQVPCGMCFLPTLLVTAILCSDTDFVGLADRTGALLCCLTVHHADCAGMMACMVFDQCTLSASRFPHSKVLCSIGS